MTALATVLWLSNLICDTVGHLAFKAAAGEGAGERGRARWCAMLASSWIWIGVVFFVANFLFWMAFLSMVPLSVAILVGSVDIFAVSLGGRIFFGEALTRRRMLSSALIAVGVALVGWG